MKMRKTLKTLGSLILPLVLTAFLVTCDGGYEPNVMEIKIEPETLQESGTEATLDITCVKPRSVNAETIKITLTLKPTLLQLKSTDMSIYSKNTIGEPKTEKIGTIEYFTEIVLGKLSSSSDDPQKLTFSISSLKTVGTGEDALTVTVEPGGVKKTLNIVSP